MPWPERALTRVGWACEVIVTRTSEPKGKLDAMTTDAAAPAQIGSELAGRITGCAYLHETREQRLTDHAAVTLTLGVDKVNRLTTGDVTEEEAAT